MKISVLFLSIFLTFNSFAAKKKSCTYSITPEDIKVTWTAFKTPKKIGVNGTFSDLGIKGPMEGSSIKEIVSGSSFHINTDLVDTQDKARDVKIAQFFFKKMMGDPAISGKVESMDGKKIILSITMNNKTQSIPLTYKIRKSKLSASGSLDVLNFSMDESLKSITAACKEKHEDKTWSDVNLAMEANFKKTCK